MKKYLSAFLFLLLSLSLFACGKKAEFKRIKKTSSSTEMVDSTSSGDETEESEAKKLAKWKGQYAAVFEDYQLIYDNSQKGGDNKETIAAEAERALQTGIQYWSVVNMFYSINDSYYTFFDLNKDGSPEMLIAGKNTDSDFYLSSLYYLKGDKPTLLSQSYVASAGGGRSAAQVYSDGKVLNTYWSSGTGEGTAVLYELQNQGDEAQVSDEKDIKMGVDDLNAIFSRSEEDLLDLGSLDWQKFEFSEKKAEVDSDKVEINKLIPAELVGTWTGSGPGGSVKVTYTASGDITVEEIGEVKHGKITSYEQVESGLYRVTSDVSQYIWPTFNLGGSGFRYEQGFRVSGNQLIYVYWTGPLDTNFSASNYRKFELDNWIYEKE